MLKNPSGMLRYVKAELDGANARRNDAIANGIEAMATTFLRPNLKIFIYEFYRNFNKFLKSKILTYRRQFQ